MIELLARHLDAKKIEIKETATPRKNDRGEVSNGQGQPFTVCTLSCRVMESLVGTAASHDIGNVTVSSVRLSFDQFG